MKNLIYITLIIFAIGCAQPEDSNSNSTKGLTTDNEPPVVVIDPDTTPDIETPQESGIKFAVITPEKLYFSNSSAMVEINSGSVKFAASRTFSVNSELIKFDASGDPEAITALEAEPETIKTVAGNNYYCKQYPPELAYSLGALYRIYSEIFGNDSVISDWYLNDWSCKKVVSAGSNVYMTDTNGGYHAVTGVYSDITHIQDDAFIIHSRDDVNKHIMFNDILEDYITNNILAAKQWQKSGDTYYSENGYTWSDADGLQENATALQDFQSYPYPVTPALPYGEQPVLLKAGEYLEGLYWVECNSGWLFRYDPTGDTLTQSYRIYAGDGLRTTGINKRETLSPLISENELYFTNDSTLYRLGLETGFINVFYGEQAEAVRF